MNEGLNSASLSHATWFLSLNRSEVARNSNLKELVVVLGHKQRG
jgi:hypothetical protein